MSRLDVCAPAEQTEGTRSQVLRWLKQVGDAVAENEPLIEIETDKVTVEVASPGAGTLAQILKQEQEEIAPGELLGRIEAAGAAAAPLAVTAAQPAATAVAAAASGPARAGGRGGGLSPAVRRLLAEHGLEAAGLTGSGPDGRIMVEDVLRAAGNAGTPAPARPAAPAPAPAPAAAAAAARSHLVPHSAVRKRIAEHMVASLLHTAPHVTTVFEADLGAVLADRARRREEFARAGVPLTLTAYFVRAAVEAIRAVPEANSRWTDSALEVYEAVHLGIATAVPGVGLVVPVLRDADSRDLLQTARGLDELVTRARAGKLSPAEVRGGTFTISNHGVSGSLIAAPIVINQPQSAILGIGKLEQRAVVSGEGSAAQILIRPRCYVSLTLDHRVMDGQEGNRFLSAFVAALAQWPAA
ncbi:MAG: 2-oxo acid dehydrogenase subunit E2 [Proteobacteria bacterium]|nr:2-oxo acid dehydrogenase subunit E2 [Pseudomonadota bacterium]